MAKPLIPFGLIPAALAPGWLLPGAGGMLLFRGEGGVASIDYTRPVGFASAEAGQIATLPGVEHVSGVEYRYGLRAVSEGGVQEHNTHIQCAVRMDPVLGTLEPVTARATELQLRRLEAGRLELCWRVAVEPGQAEPTEMDVLRAGPLGDWLDPPEAVVPACAGSAVADYRAIVADGLPNRLAVRVRAGAWAGSVSEAVELPTVDAPAAPRRL